MFNKEETLDLKVMIVGNDDVLRSGWCKKTDKLAFDKYEIDPDAIFLTEQYKILGLLKVSNVPTIMFYENSTKPIMRPDPSKFKPDEVGDAVAMAAWALAKLLIAKNEKFETMVQWLLIIAAIGAVVAAGLGFINMQKITALDGSNGGDGVSPGTTVQPTPMQLTPTPTPAPIQTVPPGWTPPIVVPAAAG